MMKSMVVICAGVIVAAWAAPARATCTWTWDCTNGCRQVPLCFSTLDIPPPRPPSVAPIPTPSVPPIARPMVPPVGTSICSPQYICSSGRCSWQNVCR